MIFLFSLWVATMMITFRAMINSVIALKPQFAREAGEKVCSIETANAVLISGRRKLPKSRRQNPRKRRYKVNTGGEGENDINENVRSFFPLPLSLLLSFSQIKIILRNVSLPIVSPTSRFITSRNHGDIYILARFLLYVVPSTWMR